MTDLTMSQFASKDDLIAAQAARIAELEAKVQHAAEVERSAILIRVKNRAVAGALLVTDFISIIADRGAAAPQAVQAAAPQPPEATTSAHSRQMCGAAPKVEPSAVSNGSWPDAPPQENIREGAPYDDPEFEKLAREHAVWGTAQSALCAQFWLTAQRRPLDRQQIQSMIDQHVGLDSCDTSLHHLARAVEHAHGIQAQRHGQ